MTNSSELDIRLTAHIASNSELSAFRCTALFVTSTQFCRAQDDSSLMQSSTLISDESLHLIDLVKIYIYLGAEKSSEIKKYLHQEFVRHFTAAKGGVVSEPALFCHWLYMAKKLYSKLKVPKSSAF